MAFDEQAFERDFFGKSASGKGGLPAVGVTEGRAAGFDEAAFEREFFGGGGQGVQAPQDVGGLPQVHVDGGLDAGEVERTEGSEGLAGGLAEFGRGLARGVVGLPEMLGKTAQFAGRQVGGAEEEELGSGLAAIGEEAEEAAPWLRESREGAGRESPLSLRGQAYESGRTVAESLGPAALGAGVGFAVGGPVGAAVGAGVGFFGAIPLFAGAQGEETYERTYAHQRKQGLSEGEAHDEALKAGWINAAIEGGGELAADVVTAGAARFLPRGVKGDLVRALASNKGAYWRAVKDISTKVLPAEMATEMGQALGQQYVESEYAGAERPGLDTALEVVIPTLILSGLAGGGAHTVGGLRRAEVSRALSDPGADMQARLRAADIVEAELQGQDPELAGIWRAHTDQSLFAGRPVVAEEDAFYRDWNETASRQREAGKQEDEVAGDAEQEQEAAQFDGTVRAPEGAREGAGEMPVAKGGVGVPAGGPEGERAEVAGEAALEQALIEQEAALAGQAGLEAQLPDRVSQALAAQPGGAQAENAMAGAFADAARTVDSPQSEIDFDPETGEIFNYPDPVYADAADYAEMDAPGDRWFQDLIQEAVESGVPESSLSALEKVHDKFDPPVVEDEVRVLIEEVKNARASTERVRGEAEEGVAEYRQEPVEEAAAPSQKQPEVGPRAEEAAVTSPPAGPSEAQVEAGAVVGAGFAPTHRSADGALLQATDEPGVYVDRDGAEVEDGYAQAVGVAGQAVAVGAVEPTSSEAAESVTEVESQGGESVSSATQGANIVPTVLASDGEARTSRKALSEALKTDDARWAALKAAGADDRSLSQAIAEHFGSEGVAGADWKATGGRQAAVGKGLPMFTFGGKTLTGQSVVRRARRILGIREKAEERLDKTKTARAVIKAESEAATSPENALPEPTQAQKVAGNYKKGHVNLHGLDISIENPRGSERSGTDRAGKPWVVEMKSTYGYIKGTRGKDKDQIDVFLGTQAENAELPVFVVDQVAPDTGAFDEHKVLMGFPNKRAARRGYVANYEKGWKGAGAITPMSMDEFKQWLESGNTTKPVDAKVSERAPTRIEQARAGETPAISAQGAAEKPEEVRGEKAEPVVGAKRDDGGLKTRAELKKTQNTVFTDEAAKRALAVLRSKLGQLSSGLDPEMMQAGLTLAGHTIESGARSFAAYAGAMTEYLGNAVKPYLRSFYESVRHYPGFDAAGMTPVEEMDEAAAAILESGEGGKTNVRQEDHAGDSGEVGGDRGNRVGDGERAGAADDLGVEAESAEDGGGAGETEPVGAVRAPDGVQPGAGGAAVPEGGDGVAGQPGAGGTGVDADGAGGRSAERNDVVRSNYEISDPEQLIGGGPKARFKNNQGAIEVYRSLEEDPREPTEAERDALARYIGWGSFGQELFQGNWAKQRPKDGWANEDQWLREHLGQQEWESAQRSIRNAHYTDPPTVQALWSMVEKLGFKGGRVLEPAMGIGNFFGLMPRNLMSDSMLSGIELDELSGGIAKVLYPQANISIKGYQESHTPDNFYDLAIGNWPFDRDGPADRRYNKLNPSLHDYFFLKTLDQVRPGGLVVGITSAGTLDKVERSIKLEMAKKADLVAAFRLPSGAFEKYAGTKVVTDVIILKKREQENKAPQTSGWIDAVEVDTPAGEPIRVNEYYEAHPEKVLGTLNFGHGTTYGRADMIVDRPADFAERLDGLAETLPEGVYEPRRQAEHIRYVTNNMQDRQNSVTVGDDGGLYVVRGEHLAVLQDIASYRVKNAKQTSAREAQIKALVGMRRAYGHLIDAEREGADNTEVLRKALRDQVEAFREAHGSINDVFGLRVIKKVNDPFYPSLAALERNAGTVDAPEWAPATILSRAVSRARRTLDKPNVRDAFVQARNTSMVLDMEAIAKTANTTEAKAAKELLASGAVFHAPDGRYVPADVYLSGNVRRKLREAKAAADQGVDMAANVKALEPVIPKDVPYFNIEAKLGAQWINDSVYQEYVGRQLAGLSEEDAGRIGVDWRVSRWKVDIPDDINVRSMPAVQALETIQAYREDKASGDMVPDRKDNVSFRRLVEAALNNRTLVMKVDAIDENGKRVQVVHEGLTKAANDRLSSIREDFSEWVWKSAERKIHMERDYNEIMNAVAASRYDGDFLTFDGMALQRGESDFNLRKHQVDAIWRGLANGRGLYAHEVGSGKTYTMAGVAVESRRLGLASKPLILAHNANSASVAAEFQEMYPGAKVLYVNNLSPKTIDTTMAQIATDDWDAVVMPHSLIDRLTLKRETLMALAQEEIAALEDEAISAAEDEGIELTVEMMNEDLADGESKALSAVRDVTAKELVRERNKILKNIEKQAQRGSREGAVFFEDMGVDMLQVDEAHKFKKPPMRTQMKVKGLNTAASGVSIQLKFLTDYIKRENNGRGVHLFTGTPITNTLGEIYHHSRYIMEDQMKRDGIADWDAWFNTFADTVDDVEYTSAGEYRPTTRLALFVNVAELRRILGQYMDVVYADEMPEFSPRKTASGKTLKDKQLSKAEESELLNGRTEGGPGRPYKKVVMDSAEMSPEQTEYMERFKSWAKDWDDAGGKQRREWMVEGDPRSPAILEQNAAKAGLDARLYDSAAADHPDSKVNRAVRNVMTHYREHPQATQAVFVERGYSDSVVRTKKRKGKVVSSQRVETHNLVKELVEKLVANGVPRDQVAIVDGKMSKEKRKIVADRMNDATVRVVIGLTETLGTGVNMQRNLRAMHHLDAPWMPGELEQRNGRGHRQGNQWNTVLEYRYLTERIDGRRWQILALKDRFIKAFMRADESVRVIEGDAADLQEGGLDATLAEAAGDPRILMREKYRKQVERLTRKERVHLQGVVEAQDLIEKNRRDAARMDKELTAIEADQALYFKARSAASAKATAAYQRDVAKWERDVEAALAAKTKRPNKPKKPVENSGFAATIEGRKYDSREAAQTAMEGLVAKLKPGEGWQDVGDIFGFKVSMRWPSRLADVQVEVTSPIDGEWRFDPSKPSVASIERSIRGAKLYSTRGLTVNRAFIQSLRDQEPRLQEVADAPFARGDDLVRAQSLYQDVVEDMDSNPVPAPGWLRHGAAVSTEVYVNGKPQVVAGHKWGADDYYVLIESDGGAQRVAYLKVQDSNGARVYDVHPHVAPDGTQAEEVNAATLDGLGIPSPDAGLETRAALETRRIGDVTVSRFSRKEAPAQVSGLDAKSVRRIARRVVGRLRLLDNGLSYQVVQSPDDFPKPLQAVMDAEGAREDVQAAIHDRVVYLVADRMRNAGEVEQAILHEVYGHYGSRRLFGRNVRQRLRKVYEAVGGDEGIRALAARHGFDMEAYFSTADSGAYKNDVQARQFLLADELLAHLQQHGPTSLPARVVEALKAFIGAVRQWFVRNGFVELAQWNDADVAHLLRRMQDAARGPGQRPRLAQGGAAQAFSRMAQGYTVGLDSLLEKTGGDLQAASKRLDTATMHPATQQLQHGRGELHFMTTEAALRDFGAAYGDLVDGFYDPVSKTFLDRADAKRIVQATYGDTSRPMHDTYLESQEYRRTRNIAQQAEQAPPAGMIVEEMDMDDPRLEGLVLPEMTVMRFARVAGDGDVPFMRSPAVIAKSISSERAKAVGEVKDWMKDAAVNMLPSALGSLTLRQLADVGGKHMPQLHRLVRGMQHYQTSRNQMAEEAKDVAETWRKLPIEQARQLAEVMHQATIAGVDPAEEKYEPVVDVKEARRRIRFLERQIAELPGERGERYNQWRAEISELKGKIRQEKYREKHQDEIRALWRGLVGNYRKAVGDYNRAVNPTDPAATVPTKEARAALFAALPEGARPGALFIDARDSYLRMHERMEQAIVRRIEEAELADDVRKAAILQVRNEFQKAREAGPYFPLQRFGKYYAVAERETGETYTDKETGEERAEKEYAFHMFDSPRERRRQRADIEVDGWAITKEGMQKDMAASMDAVSEQFVADTVMAMEEKLGSYEGKKAADVLYQSFLASMPYLSHRVHFIHRKKTSGFSEDALRAYAHNQAHLANQVARMEVQPEWESALRDADKAVKDMAGDRTREEQLLNEANRRFEWLMNPQGSQWAAWATTAGFIWYLGLSPAAGLVNISQTAIVAFPELAARYGAGKALKALQKSMLETLQARRKWGTRGDYSTWQNLSADERKAFKRWHDDGVIDITQAQMLMGLAETDSSQYNPKVAKALEVTGSIFQEAEVINRQATLLAGYRLARDNGSDHDAAVEQSEEAAWDSHFDYSNANRARWMQSNLAKVLLLFRSYSQHMTYYLWRNVYQATKGESKAVRDEARKKVVGVLGMTGMFAGTMGLPLAGAVFGVANAVQALFGDDDEPWDADTEWRSFLADFGLAGAAVDRGVLNALTGADWSSRTSLNDMWFRTPDREMEGRDLYAYYLGQLAGPLGGIGESVFRAADLAGEGHIDRAMETATPKFMKAPLRAVRYATEGVTNKAGDAVVPDESLTPWDVVLQASGFTPDVARAQWDTNRARKNYEQDILRRRRDLIGGYALAVMQGDREAIQAGIKRIREYNKASPAMPISRQAIQQSLNARRRYRKESMAGINLNRRLRAELAETRVAQ